MKTALLAALGRSALGLSALGLPALVLTALAAPGPTLAAPGQHAEIDVLPGWRGPDGAHMAALRITLEDGWKTYWRAPGEAGIPPRFDWSGSENLETVKILWPVPEIMESDGITTLGYSHELVLPIEVTPADPTADIAIDGELAFGICHDICMPLSAEVSAVLPAGTAEEDPRIVAALAARPGTATQAEVVSSHCAVEAISDGLRVTARIDMPAVGPAEYVVIEPVDRSIWVSEAMTTRTDNVLLAEADLVPPDAKPFELDPATLRLTVLAEGRGVDIHGCTEVR